MVSVELVAPEATDAGADVAVMPAGAPVTASVTAPVKPPERARVTVELALCPAAKLTAAGLAVSENDGVAAAVTVRLTVAVCGLTPVPLAVRVIPEVPTAAFAPAVSVMVPVVAAAPITTGGAVTPAGRPVAVTVTSPP